MVIELFLTLLVNGLFRRAASVLYANAKRRDYGMHGSFRLCSQIWSRLNLPYNNKNSTIRYAYMQCVPLTHSFFPSSSYVVYPSLFCNPCLSL